MPRTPIDYSKCLIYKLCCKNPEITDIYVGHTTDKVKRKSHHRIKCNNQNGKEYNYNVYQFIRANGGFENWDFIILEEYPCENSNQACSRERHWLETLRATLNSCIPSRTKQEYNKTYREENREIINEKKREYYSSNKEIIYEKSKQYIKNNNHKIDCVCGGKYMKCHQSDHFKSNKHIKYLSGIE